MRPRQPQTPAVAQHHREVATRARLQLPHPVQVHDARPVDARETIAVEPRRQRAEVLSASRSAARRRARARSCPVPPTSGPRRRAPAARARRGGRAGGGGIRCPGSPAPHAPAGSARTRAPRAWPGASAARRQPRVASLQAARVANTNVATRVAARTSRRGAGRFVCIVAPVGIAHRTLVGQGTSRCRTMSLHAYCPVGYMAREWRQVAAAGRPTGPNATRAPGHFGSGPACVLGDPRVVSATPDPRGIATTLAPGRRAPCRRRSHRTDARPATARSPAPRRLPSSPVASRGVPPRSR